MAKVSKGRSRTAARKLKDKWRSKQWYSIISPPVIFDDQREIGQTLCDDSEKLQGRNLEVSLQNITGHYKDSHVKLRCKINSISGLNVNTVFTGHHLTTEYTKRLVQRRKSKMNGIVDVITRDGGKIRVKMLLTTNRRINSSKQSLVVKSVTTFVANYARKKTTPQFIRDMLTNALAIQVFRYVKPIYPLKRVEVYKSHILRFLTTRLPVEEIGVGVETPEEPKEQPEEPKAELESQEEKTSEPASVEEPSGEQVPEVKGDEKKPEATEGAKDTIKEEGESTGETPDAPVESGNMQTDQ